MNTEPPQWGRLTSLTGAMRLVRFAERPDGRTSVAAANSDRPVPLRHRVRIQLAIAGPGRYSGGSARSIVGWRVRQGVTLRTENLAALPRTVSSVQSFLARTAVALGKRALDPAQLRKERELLSWPFYLFLLLQ